MVQGGERNSRQDVIPETDGREETGGKGSIIMALGFVDPENVFDTLPREMVMATLRLMGVPEAKVSMVVDT